MDILMDILIILITIIVIYFSGKKFAGSSSKLGDYLHVPKSVKGAILDAVSSSLPELFVAIFSILSFNHFDVAIGTITGSAIFNILVISGVCILISPAIFKVNEKIVTRDGLFYVISIIALLIALSLFSTWNLIIPLIFLIIYGVYLMIIIKDTKKYRLMIEQLEITKKISVKKEVASLIINLFVIAAATYLLTGSSISLSSIIEVPAIIIAFIIVAIGTSVSDSVISFVNAKKGSIDDAASNVFGSNIFNILVGISIPILTVSFLYGPVEIIFTHFEILIGLLISTAVILIFLVRNYTLNKKQGWILLLMYCVFIAYVILISIV